MRLVLKIFIAIYVCTPAFADGPDLHVFPKASATGPGSLLVQKDLLKTYDSEVRESSRGLPKSLTAEKRNAAINIRLQKLNDEFLRKMQEPVPSVKVTRLTEAQAQSLHESILTHPIVSPAGSKKYDELTRKIGYCFGTAAYIHIELLRRGVDPASIGKVFALGKLNYQGTVWEYHVATVVRSSNGSWWAIDGYGPRVHELKAWTAQVQQWSTPGEPMARFYFTSAEKFLPVPGGYTEKRLLAPSYKGYFSDLSKWFQENPVRAKDIIGQEAG